MGKVLKRLLSGRKGRLGSDQRVLTDSYRNKLSRADIWFGSFPTPFPLFRRSTGELREKEPTCWREREGGESLFLYKSINTLWDLTNGWKILGLEKKRMYVAKILGKDDITVLLVIILCCEPWGIWGISENKIISDIHTRLWVNRQIDESRPWIETETR